MPAEDPSERTIEQETLRGGPRSYHFEEVWTEFVYAKVEAQSKNEKRGPVPKVSQKREEP